MYKNKTENVEVYFICNKKQGMEIIETYYDEVLDTHYWYFNAYLAYKSWKSKFKNLPKLGHTTRMLLTVAASRYIIYKIDNKEYANDSEKETLLKDMEKIEPFLQKIIKENDIISDLK